MTRSLQTNSCFSLRSMHYVLVFLRRQHRANAQQNDCRAKMQDFTSYESGAGDLQITLSTTEILEERLENNWGRETLKADHKNDSSKENDLRISGLRACGETEGTLHHMCQRGPLYDCNRKPRWHTGLSEKITPNQIYTWCIPCSFQESTYSLNFNLNFTHY